jgi:hypothetical protein
MHKSRRLIGLLVTMGTIVALTPAAAPAAQGASPLSLLAADDSITVERWSADWAQLDFGVYVVAGPNKFEVQAQRPSYSKPIVATQIVRSGNSRKRVKLPAGTVTDFNGLPRFMNIKLKNAAGRTVINQDSAFCPGTDQARQRPDAPDRSPYPSCGFAHPFTRGAVWGLQAGWSTPAPSIFWSSSDGPELPDGAYTATVSIKQPYRKLFKLRGGQSTTTVRVDLRTTGDSPSLGAAPPPPSDQPDPGSRPSGAAVVPAGPRPDLRPLPAFNIGLNGDGESRQQRNELGFSATVWVAGNSSLVVDGFRRTGEAAMDAYQYFYDARGRQVGFAPVGMMEWDDRDGHNHWHFTDFARYRLLDARKRVVARGGKESYCLANTDAIDYTLRRANWKPGNTDLHTSCGGRNSVAVRQVLDIGNGDTYSQGLPGQSFDVTNLPNGTYYIEIAANPERKLYESNVRNNVSLRKVILGGTTGARTVRVPRYGLIRG